MKLAKVKEPKDGKVDNTKSQQNSIADAKNKIGKAD